MEHHEQIQISCARSYKDGCGAIAKAKSANLSGVVAGWGSEAMPVIGIMYQAFNLANALVEARGMVLIVDKLLEMTEMVAYLDVLLKMYDSAITAHEETIDRLQLEKAAYGTGQCRAN